MIHFFLTFSKAAEDTPFARRATELSLRFRAFAALIRHRRQHRLWMAFIGRPQTVLFALRSAWRSLVLDPEPPRVVVVWTHIEAMIVAFVRALRGRRQTKIVLVGFILTQRRQPLHNWLRGVYFRWLFSLVQLVVVHSRAEAERYASIYRQSAARFVFIRWGSYVIKLPENELHLAPGRAGADVLAVGRSGRDYPTLFRALGGTELCVRVICDVPAALADCTPAPNIEIMDRCFGGDYLRELNNASCMVIPLGVADISAGQMVLLQAMEMGKAVVITRTATTLDYVTDGQEALLVEPGDAEGLRRAVTQLVADLALRERLARQARDSFNRHFTVPAFVDALVTEIQKLDPAAGRAAPP